MQCIDDFSTGLRRNIAHLKRNKNFSLRHADVTTYTKAHENLNHILHFASRASPEEYQQHPIETLLTNSLGTKNILELARQHDCTLTYASSSEVYGNPEPIPTPETCGHEMLWNFN